MLSITEIISSGKCTSQEVFTPRLAIQYGERRFAITMMICHGIMPI